MKVTPRNTQLVLPLVTLAVLSIAIGWRLAPRATAADVAVQIVAVEPDMHEFMEYFFQPTYQRLQASMAQIGTDSPNWKAIKSDSLILAESTTLLLGRGEAGEASWQKHVQETRAAAAELYNAAKAKDVQLSRDRYTTMITRCNACHQDFAGGEHQLMP
jgi:hypothetical protein